MSWFVHVLKSVAYNVYAYSSLWVCTLSLPHSLSLWPIIRTFFIMHIPLFFVSSFIRICVSSLSVCSFKFAVYECAVWWEWSCRMMSMSWCDERALSVGFICFFGRGGVASASWWWGWIFWLAFRLDQLAVLGGTLSHPPGCSSYSVFLHHLWLFWVGPGVPSWLAFSALSPDWCANSAVLLSRPSARFLWGLMVTDPSPVENQRFHVKILHFDLSQKAENEHFFKKNVNWFFLDDTIA